MEEFRIRTEGIAIVMAIDQSGSMRALDFQFDGKPVNRLEVVKRVFRDFVEGKGALKGRPDDKIGLVAFGGFASDRCPLTLDHGALLQVLDGVKIPEPVVDANGAPVNEALYNEELTTAIGDALALACDRLKDAPDKSKVLILLSDGGNDAGVIVGSNGPVPFPVQDRFGNVQLVKREVEMDEKLMREIAETTGGKYFSASDTASLEHVYEDIDKLEKTKSEGVLYTEYRELYRWLLFPALGLLVLELLLTATRLRTLP